MKRTSLQTIFLILLIPTILSLYRISHHKTDSAPWMDKRIQTDLAAFDEIHRTELDRMERCFLEKEVRYMRLKIHQGTLGYTAPPLESIYIRRIDGYMDYLSKVHLTQPLPDTDLLIALDDGFDESALDSIHAPVFCISKLKSQTKTLVLPELFLYPKILQKFANVTKHLDEFPWNQKINIGYWRGSTTGQYNTAENWMHSLRTQLVLFSEKIPDLLDCAFSIFVQGSEETETAMRNRGLFKESTQPAEQLKYKYLIAIDGNTFASSLKWQLFSNSVILKNDSNWMEWYDTALVPHQHFIPFKADFSDLSEKIEWLRQNDALAKDIAENARLFAQKTFTPEGVELYIRKLLTAYAERLKP